MRLISSVAIVFLCAAAAPAAAQVELDRTLQRVYGTPIMTSDVRQVRLLRLAGAGVDTDVQIQTFLENRLLMLREVAHGAGTEPDAAVIAARRRAWEATWPAGTDLPALMARAGLSDQALTGWFRDDLHIEAYLNQRFGQVADARRAARVSDWIRDLRRRANLEIK